MKKTIFLTLLIFFSNYKDIIGQGDASRTRKIKNKNNSTDKKEATQIPNSLYSEILGAVIEETTAKPLEGVTVKLESDSLQKGVFTDLNGKFSFSGIPAGKYTLKLQYVSYETKEIRDVLVETGKSYQWVFALKEVGTNVEEVVIQSELKKESEAASLIMQKMNLRMMDIFSGDMILKTSSDLFITTSLSRMPGVSYIEDRYLTIRGMPERYNMVLLNGALLPIIQNERQLFDLSNLPSSMISQIQLVKACLSDMPTNFGGGLVAFETADIPTSNSTQINYQMIYNSFTTFKPITLGGQDKSKGFFGFMGSPKPYVPSNFPNSSQIQALSQDSEELANYGKQVNSDFVTDTYKPLPGQSVSLTLKRRYENGDKILGFTSITNAVQQTFQQKIDQNVLTVYDENLGYNPVTDSSFYPLNYKQENFNQLFNLGFKNKNLEVNFKNLFTHTQWNKYVRQEGAFYFEKAWEDYLYLAKRFEKQSLFSNQLQVNYRLSKDQKFSFLSFNSFVRFDDPNFYPLNISKNTDGNWHISDSYTPVDKLLYSTYTAKMYDRMNGGNLSLESSWLKNKIITKIGIFGYFQKRNFDSRELGIFPTLDSTVNIDVTQILIQGDNFSYDRNLIRPGGFFLADDTRKESAYQGNTTNIAPFFQTTYHLNEKFTLYAGIRLEWFHTMVYSSGNQAPKELVHDKKITDLLPAFIVSYNINEKNKLKASLCQSVIRPDMRELSNFSFLNRYNSTTWEGNPEIIRSKITGADFKYEFFPNGLNLFSVSLFYKYIEKPLEQVLKGGAEDYLNVYVLRNSEFANNYGFELEVKQKLGDKNYLENFLFYGNFLFQQSKVKDDRTGLSNRPIQGQSPYLINCGILFQEPQSKVRIDVFYNRIGRQIVIIGLPGVFNNLYVLPRHRIDLQISKSFMKERLDVKLALQDLLNQPFYKVQFRKEEDQKTGSFEESSLVTKMKQGRIVTLSIQYKF